MKAFIQALGACVPANRVSNDKLAETMETTDEWIFSHTGIRNRHLAAPGQANSDFAIPAAQQALQRSGIAGENVDLVIVATTTPDHLSFPTVSCLLQNAIGAKKAGAFDLYAACTGFIYGLEIARNFIENGAAKHIVVVGSELMSSIIDWDDRNTCVLFGDGAGAAVVSASAEGSSSEILYSLLRAEGDGAESLKRPFGGSRNPLSEEAGSLKQTYLQMQGRTVYNFAVRVLSETVHEILEHNNLKPEDITYVVPHQANIRIIEAAAKRSGIPLEKFYTNIGEYANTSAASIPLAMNEMAEKGVLRRGDLILTLGFGAGLTYGGNLIRF